MPEDKERDMEGTITRESMAARLQRYLPGRGFLPVNLHAEGMILYYHADGDTAVLTWVIEDSALAGLDADRYKSQYETIRSMFASKGYTTVHSLTLFLTSDIGKARGIGADTAFWIVDESYGRLIIYENQPEEYMGLRGMIEQNLHFGADIRNEDGMQKTGIRVEKAAAKPTTPRRGLYRYESLSDHAGSRTRKLAYLFTVVLMVANCVVYLFQLRYNVGMVEAGANYWIRIKEDAQYYRLFTSMFLHGSLDHIVGNMMTLFFVGMILEERVGHWRYLVIYIASGILASVTSCFYHMKIGEYVYSIGASGAIFGILGAQVFMTVATRDRRDSSVLVRIGIFGAYMLYQAFRSGDNIDNAAHLGGFVAGTLIAFLFWECEKLNVWRRRRARM